MPRLSSSSSLSFSEVSLSLAREAARSSSLSLSRLSTNFSVRLSSARRGLGKRRGVGGQRRAGTRGEGRRDRWQGPNDVILVVVFVIFPVPPEQRFFCDQRDPLNQILPPRSPALEQICCRGVCERDLGGREMEITPEGPTLFRGGG